MIDLIAFIRVAYLSAACLVLVVYLLPPLRDRFLAYGARAAAPAVTSAEEEKAALETPNAGLITTALDRLAAIQVPHSWFTSFYAVSVACSLFWASQIVLGGSAFRIVAAWTHEQETSMTFRQVLLAWSMMLLQGSRRLWESLVFHRPSNSQMWVGHWLLGIFFYTGMSGAIWIEGIPALSKHTFTIDDIDIHGPSLRTFVSILLFILASGLQHDCHAYLTSLKAPAKHPDGKEIKPEYKLPEHPVFSGLIAPHYTAECLIYVSLAVLSAPQGAWLNWTLASALLFVVVNLGVTADVTKVWYENKFGKKAVAGKARMIPFLW